MQQHRPGSLKQSNKPFKSGKHLTKGAQKRKQRGKIDVKKNSGKSLLTEQKEQRKNKAKQKRDAQREKIQEQYRNLSKGEAPPRVVTIIPLGETNHSSDQIHESIYRSVFPDSIGTQQRTFHVAKWKQRISIIPCSRNINDIIFATQVSNILVFVVPETGIDAIGYETIRIIRAQGFPAMMAVLETSKSNPQSQKKSLEKEFCYEFAEKSFKVLAMSKVDAVVRGICQISLEDEPLSKFLPRGFLTAESKPIFFQNGESKGAEISGYLRGGSLSANQLLHIPGFGDFQMHAIYATPDPNPSKVSHNSDSMDTAQVQRELLEIATPEKRESLQVENEPDPLDAEQTMWNEDEGNKKSDIRRVPKGTSAYQATWILEDGDEAEETQMKLEGEEEMTDAMVLPDADDDDDDGEEFEYIDVSDTASVMSENYAKKQLEQEDIDFPDEVETPREIPARIRFQRYRGLKSFRTSPWDTKEELPRDYAKIFQYRSLKRTQQRVLEEHEGIPSGTYITIQVLDVPQSFVEEFSPQKPLIAMGLFPFERKISVLNFAVRRSTNYTEPIASKDELIFYCGGRTLLCSPIFSEHTSDDKHKYERFWMPTTSSVASIYGPTMFIPTPLLVFKRVSEGEELGDAVPVDGMILVGSGSLISVDPDRLNIKKITITGEPFKVLKRKAVIRRMFHNAEDIQWFKPVELRTRLGHTGNIHESIGTHGHMRCLFDSQLKQHDVIMMNLYKRIYPTWKPSYLLHEQNDIHNI